MLRFLPDPLKTKKMCKHATKKLPFRIKYVGDQYQTNGMLGFIPDWYKNQMCDRAADNYAHALRFVPKYSKTLTMCDKVVDTSPSGIQFVPECYKAQKIFDKTVDTCFYVFDSAPDQCNINL